jgi:sugar/nucleoside kinase (ribokinase family)
MILTEKILLIGEIFFDTIYTGFKKLPEKGQEIFCSNFKTTAGGMAITAIGMSRLGLNVELAGAVGEDFQGDYVLNTLKNEKVGTKYLKKINDAVTNNSTALVYNGDRSFISYRGVDFKAENILKKFIDNNTLKEFTRLHISLFPGLKFINLIKKVSNFDLKISLVTGWNAAEYYALHKNEFKEIMEYVDIFFCNELEAKKITGFSEIKEACIYLNNLTSTVITLGENGAVTFDSKEGFIKSSALDIKFKDPTGAGDSFISGYIASVVNNYSLSKSLRTANICASLSTRDLGGTTAFPESMNEITKYLD